ncbi:efflux RND transporter periplasmic adaptor subunit [Mesorhizobium retamae]|uniref:Efflux RND transporter periplasmic adaptor subunit n=1 Tax=Mesorhizobium retamae TaxID=2912854 RepID=A0ABS9QKG7_9HYPH|nr:efflux RND transporter periplasmic adaptor subunit [Mesorhizobium sp. IRAMC:0171]MCG7507931.1 efflux RND transporter periplasmic adaptor subunit [Mesorhizobium sp. IRAMC:0171]
MIKRFIVPFILLVLVVLLAGGIIWFNFFRDKMIAGFFANMPANVLTVSAKKIEPATWTPGVEAIGTVGASMGVDLTMETSGVVKEILFKANDKVENGQLLVRLDDAVEQADLIAAKTKATLDQQALGRAQALRKTGVGTEAALDTANANAETSIAQVTKAQAQADLKLLKAPFGGVTGIPKIELGQYVAPGNAIVTLQDMETMRVDFTVPEQQLEKLKVGQPVTFGPTSEDMPFKGVVTGIDPKIDPSSRLVSVRARIDNPEGRLSPGQFVQVRVELPKEDNVITVPQTALTTSLYGDYVYTVVPAKPKEGEAKPAEAKPAEGAKPADGAAAPAAQKPAEGPQLTANQVFVKVGRRFGGVAEIVEGVKAGDEVVTAGQNRLSNGALVKIDNTVDPSKPAEQKASAQ